MIDLDAILMRRADEQTSGVRLPPGGRDTWTPARRKPGPKGPRTKLLPETVRRVRAAKAGGETMLSISVRLGVSKGLVQRICDGSAYAEVE